jgi:hypothetical protein
MGYLSRIEWSRISAGVATLCILLWFSDCVDGPRQKQDPHKEITYGLDVILAQADQDVSADSTYLSGLLEVTYGKWDFYTKGCGINNHYSKDYCNLSDRRLDSLYTCVAEDTADYLLYDATLSGLIHYHDPYTGFNRAAANLKAFLELVKHNAIGRLSVSGKSVVIVSAGQNDGSFLNVPEPHWDNVPSGVVLGAAYPSKDSNGNILNCEYSDSLPTGVVFTRTCWYLYIYLHEKVAALGGAADAAAWSNSPPGEYSWTKYYP